MTKDRHFNNQDVCFASFSLNVHTFFNLHSGYTGGMTVICVESRICDPSSISDLIYDIPSEKHQSFFLSTEKHEFYKI